MRKLVSASPTLQTGGAYTAGYLLGGKLTFSGAVGGNYRGMLESIVMIDQAKQSISTDLVLFGTNPTNTTFTDNAVLDIHDTDMLAVVGIVNIAAANYFGFNDNSCAVVKDIQLPFELDSTTLYGALVTRGTPTYAAASDIKVKLTIRCE